MENRKIYYLRCFNFGQEKEEWDFKPLKMNNIKSNIMAVKHIPTGIVHSGSKGGRTGCGESTNEHATHWINTSERVDCGKNGCK